jgi:hypothetical protein
VSDPYTIGFDDFAWRVRQDFAASMAISNPRAHMVVTGLADGGFAPVPVRRRVRKRRPHGRVNGPRRWTVKTFARST